MFLQETQELVPQTRWPEQPEPPGLAALREVQALPRMAQEPPEGEEDRSQTRPMVSLEVLGEEDRDTFPGS